MIKVEVILNPKLDNIHLNLNSFFTVAYPLNYSHVLSRLNSYLTEKQSLLFHDKKAIDKFVEVFKKPRDVVNFMIENKESNELLVVEIGDVIYVTVKNKTYIFYEE